VIDACGADLVVFVQHGDRFCAGFRRDRRRAAFGVAIALRGFGLLLAALALTRLAAVHAPDSFRHGEDPRGRSTRQRRR
jgi:hypothetical protein